MSSAVSAERRAVRIAMADGVIVPSGFTQATAYNSFLHRYQSMHS